MHRSNNHKIPNPRRPNRILTELTGRSQSRHRRTGHIRDNKSVQFRTLTQVVLDYVGSDIRGVLAEAGDVLAGWQAGGGVDAVDGAD